VADIVLTHHGLAGGATELNPVAGALMATIGTLPAMTALKGAALLVGVVAWTVIPTRHRGLVPLGLAVPWTIASLVNAVVVFG
jgi:predicted anti-sigma-YlaC factor YlaD